MRPQSETSPVDRLRLEHQKVPPVHLEIRSMRVAIGSEPDESKDFAIIIAMTIFEPRIMHSTAVRRSFIDANERDINEHTYIKPFQLFEISNRS